ncbi:MAG: hypothetical protein V1728_03790 [Candidatus Micrarchaeota archaeon]
MHFVGNLNKAFGKNSGPDAEMELDHIRRRVIMKKMANMAERSSSGARQGFKLSAAHRGEKLSLVVRINLS